MPPGRLSFDPSMPEAVRLCLSVLYLGRVTSPSAKDSFLEDQFVSLNLASLSLSLSLCNTRRKIQIQTKLDQPSRKNGQHQTSETRPQLQTYRKKRSWTPQETMATRQCRKSSSDLIHGGR